MISAEAVTWAYRLFLDREPDTPQAMQFYTNNFSNTQKLRAAFLCSDEYRRKNGDGHRARMHIDEAIDELPILLQHVQDSWQHLGKIEPYWSVLSSDEYLSSNIESTRQAFYESGRSEVNQIFADLERNDITGLKTCIEYGCGVGRVTGWLSERFDLVHGYDISEEHLKIAEEHLKKNNIKLHQIRTMNDIKAMPKVDLIYSSIVLQHNPPPVIESIIQRFAEALNPGGVMLFQVPTYLPNYSFNIKEYMGQKGLGMEMHALPQSRVFRALKGLDVLEVWENNVTGIGVSNVFLARKG